MSLTVRYRYIIYRKWRFVKGFLEIILKWWHFIFIIFTFYVGRYVFVEVLRFRWICGTMDRVMEMDNNKKLPERKINR